MTEEINEMINKFCDSVEKRINQYELEKENAELKDYSQRMENQRENYYKEYLRLKQENEELKEKIIELSEEKGHLIVENNTLKESNQSLSMLGTDLASANETVRKEFFRADKNKDMWREKAEKYRSALEEIRENLVKLKTNDEDDFFYEYSKIEDKINEVLN